MLFNRISYCFDFLDWDRHWLWFFLRTVYVSLTGVELALCHSGYFSRWLFLRMEFAPFSPVYPTLPINIFWMPQWDQIPTQMLKPNLHYRLQGWKVPQDTCTWRCSKAPRYSFGFIDYQSELPCWEKQQVFPSKSYIVCFCSVGSQSGMWMGSREPKYSPFQDKKEDVLHPSGSGYLEKVLSVLCVLCVHGCA